MERVEQPGEVKPEVQATAEDMAARDYQILMPKFWAKLEPMSRRQVQRVFHAIMEYPLASGYPSFSYPAEKEAFYLGIQIMDCKFVLQKAVMELVANKEKMDAFQADLKKLTEDAANFQVGDQKVVADENGVRIEPTGVNNAL